MSNDCEFCGQPIRDGDHYVEEESHEGAIFQVHLECWRKETKPNCNNEPYTDQKILDSL